MVTYLQLIYNLQQLPKPEHHEEKALSGDVLPSRCSQQKLSGLGGEIKPVAASAMHLLPTPLLPSSLTMSPEVEASAELCRLLWHRTTIPTFHGETQKLLWTTEQHLREQRGVKPGQPADTMWEGASCSEGSSLKASWRPNGTRNVQQLWWELGPGPGMGSSCCDERNTHQSLMWVWAPFSRWQTCFYLSIANRAQCWEERPLHWARAAQSSPGRGRQGGSSTSHPWSRRPTNNTCTRVQLTKAPS